MNVHENALYYPRARSVYVCDAMQPRGAVYSFIRVPRIEIDDRARADDNCAKSFGQAQQQMVIDKAINHSFRSRELY